MVTEAAEGASLIYRATSSSKRPSAVTARRDVNHSHLNMHIVPIPYSVENLRFAIKRFLHNEVTELKVAFLPKKLSLQ